MLKILYLQHINHGCGSTCAIAIVKLTGVNRVGPVIRRIGTFCPLG